jgi:3-hydroxyisobutyrate dehydrogenase-like beta-hydroxyacid dehydrogenase
MAREVAQSSELLLVTVVDDEEVRAVVEGRDGVLAGAGLGAVVAVCSSVRPDTCRRLAANAGRRGVDLVDAALVRGERGAEAGALLLMCGGSPGTIDRCRPVFEAFASDVVRVGDVGAGQAAKIANNILLWSCIRANFEALRLTHALGVDPSAVRAALTLGSGANRPLEEWGSHRLRWPGKDLELALALAAEAAVEVPFVRALAPLMSELRPDDLRRLDPVPDGEE